MSSGLKEFSYLMSGYAVFLRALDAEGPAPHVEAELPAGSTVECELVEEVDMGVTVTVRHEVPFRLYLMDCRTHHNEWTVEASPVEGYDLVVALDSIPELYEDLFLGRSLEADAFFVKRQKRFPGVLEINSALAAVRVEHADGYYLAGEWVERETFFYFLFFFVGFRPPQQIILDRFFQRVKISSDSLYIEY